MNHKTILVTGASRGIGKAIALTYARNGWDVVITCLRREEELKKTQREIEALGVSCLAWMGDAGDFESCSRLFDAPGSWGCTRCLPATSPWAGEKA